MRILANYGYKNNGDSFMVSMETLGDCPKEQVDATVDELFRMARSAIQRQVAPEVQVEEPKKEPVTIPEPRKANGNGNGNGKHANGNGNGKPVLKDPGAPISAKQRSLIIKLAKEKGEFIEGLSTMNMGDASHVIEELLAVTA